MVNLKMTPEWRKRLLSRALDVLKSFKPRAKGKTDCSSHESPSLEPIPEDTATAIEALCVELTKLEEDSVLKVASIELQESILVKLKEQNFTINKRREQLFRTITLLKKVKELIKNG